MDHQLDFLRAGRWRQTEGPTEATDWNWTITVLVWGTRTSSLFEERRALA